MKILLTSIPVNDPLQAFKFYTEVLGFVERLYLPEGRLAIVAAAEDPAGAGLLLEPNDHPASRAYQEAAYSAGLPIIVFGAQDIQQEYERLLGLGVVFRREPTTSEQGTETLFEDTCGNLVQLYQL
ncbi:MAG: VOC family protein [Candidatus Promineifilaceae bacterium]